MDKSLEQREAMVNGQIRPNRVTDERITEAMLAVPREAFLPKELRGVAYLDEDLPIAGDRCLMEPLVFARLLQAAEIKDTDAVLDIGCTTGYSSAVLAHLASAVVAVEADETLAEKADQTLAELGIDNVAVVRGPLVEGYASEAPYDVIFINGMVETVPQALLDQLDENARMLLVVSEHGVGKAKRYSKIDGLICASELFDAQVPALAAFERRRAFAF